MSVLAYIRQQLEEATTDDARAKFQQAYDDYASVMDKIAAAEAAKDGALIAQQGQ